MKWKGTATGIGLLVVTVVAITLLVKGLYPVDLPASRDPDFFDTVFDNGGVVWAARLLLVSAAGVLAFGGTFIVLSIGIRMKNSTKQSRSRRFTRAVETIRGIDREPSIVCFCLRLSGGCCDDARGAR